MKWILRIVTFKNLAALKRQNKNLGSHYYGFKSCSLSIDLSGPGKGMAGGNSYASFKQKIINMETELKAMGQSFALGTCSGQVGHAGAERQVRDRLQSL